VVQFLGATDGFGLEDVDESILRANLVGMTVKTQTTMAMQIHA